MSRQGDPILYKKYQKEYALRRRCGSFEGWLKRTIYRCKDLDMKNNRPFDLDLPFILALLEKQEYKCAISGLIMNHENHSLRAVSIDRINSQGGHTKDNVQLVCIFINQGKWNAPDAEIRACIEDIRQKAIKDWQEKIIPPK